MTYSYPRRITPEETQWLAESWEQEGGHVCRRSCCWTPYGCRKRTDCTCPNQEIEGRP